MTAYQHRSMSQILAPQAEVKDKALTAAEKAAAAAPDNATDPKYAGKTTDQVIEMHQNAEQRLGQIQNEVGTLRGLVSDLSQIQRTVVDSPTAEQDAVTVTGDELLADPVSAINSIIKPQLEAARVTNDAHAAETLLHTENAQLLNDFSDLNEIVASPEFAQFAQRTPGRQADFNVAARGTGVAQVRAARRLLEDFNDFKLLATPEPTNIDLANRQVPARPLTPTEQARAVTTESGGTGAPISGKPQLFESDVIALINSDVAKYRSPSYQAELMSAIKEGRFVKNS